MNIGFREATRDYVPAIVGLLRDDPLGATRGRRQLDRCYATFDAMAREPGNALIVGEAEWILLLRRHARRVMPAPDDPDSPSSSGSTGRSLAAPGDARSSRA